MLDRKFLVLPLLFMVLFSSPSLTSAKEDWQDASSRKALYLKTAAITGVPWTLIAGCDQYAHNIAALRIGDARRDTYLDTPFHPIEWTGIPAPDAQNKNALLLSFFGGTGRDGNGDGLAERANPEDRLFSIAEKIAEAGPGEQNHRIGLWQIYHRGKAVEMIETYAAIFAAFNTVDLSGHCFPLPLGANYDYESTWGARRGWGGLRIHEGTDLFANYGTPVFASAYGVIEMIGWNKYGGWRIGLRDIEGNYHYYAHLNGYAPRIHRGTVTAPGETIGYVGSSGYGPRGTMGKFPPHLHYGFYKDNGRTEFSIDPYPYLRAWERQTLQKKKQTSRIY
ncbi:M23 family metallopeptidase [Sporolactobacillus spathodeae]|uniref:Murein DD-endopeptidase MepM/ murein hydrolase activator NlpD n=1 Tax=Sporolactobacillus spathodeae TaxID=1465502 RepID=A0ABS2Q4A8_9BACL|nr:M23 family metallopeptidase [Sporolactobacillus spathodeae]MBM7656612.1 murein DD-endopeptidase MepM/ murein hydrolase activator NlpD [Sporolactobacillus spathodeae]